MKQILVIKDPNDQVGFEVLCRYAEAVQKRLGSQVAVLPIWPDGEVELIGDKRKMKLLVKTLEDIVEDLEIQINEGSNNSEN